GVFIFLTTFGRIAAGFFFGGVGWAAALGRAGASCLPIVTAWTRLSASAALAATEESASLVAASRAGIALCALVPSDPKARASAWATAPTQATKQMRQMTLVIGSPCRIVVNNIFPSLCKPKCETPVFQRPSERRIPIPFLGEPWGGPRGPCAVEIGHRTARVP